MCCHGSCSAPVVSHHFDGLLRSVGSGHVAARYRTWGSLGFGGACRRRPKMTRAGSTFPPALYPPKVFSSSAAVPHRWGLLPPDRSSRSDSRRPPDEPAWTNLGLPLFVSRNDAACPMDARWEFPPSDTTYARPSLGMRRADLVTGAPKSPLRWTQGCPWPTAISTRTWSHRPESRPDRRTSSPIAPKCRRDLPALPAHRS